MKQLLLLALLFSYQLIEAQISIGVDAAIVSTTKLQLIHSTNSDLLGSSITGDQSNGFLLRFNIQKKINDKMNLKLGLSRVEINKNLKYNLSTVFLNLDTPASSQSSFVNRPFNFTEINLGFNFPISLSEKLKANFEISALSLINSNPSPLTFTASSSRMNSNLIGNYSFEREGSFVIEKKISFGTSAGINYAYRFSKFPLNFHLGIIGSYLPKTTTTGNLKTTSIDNIILTDFKGNFSYLGFNIGLSYSFNKMLKKD